MSEIDTMVTAARQQLERRCDNVNWNTANSQIDTMVTAARQQLERRCDNVNWKTANPF